MSFLDSLTAPTQTKQKTTGTSSSDTSGATTQNSTTSTPLPGYIADASQSLLGDAGSTLLAPAMPYTGTRVASLTPDQQAAFDATSAMNTNAPNLLPQALAGVNAYASAPAQNVNFYSAVDPNSPLGSIAGYMNPYASAVLDPTLQKIYDAADKARLNLNSSATMAGSFGDARNGVEQSNLDLNTMRSVGETSGALLKQMYDTMMGERQTDLSRLTSTDQANAGYNETALNRGLTGANDKLNLQGQEQNQQLQRIAALLGAGNQEQAQSQAGLDANYQEFLRQIGQNNSNLGLYSSILGGIPYDKTVQTTGSGTTSSDTSGKTNSTTVNTQPNNSLWQLAGTLAGAAFAPMTGGASLALPGLLGGGGSSTPSTASLDPFAGSFTPGYA